MLHNIFYYTFFYPFTLLVILLGLPFSLLGPDYMHRCGRFWAKTCLKAAGIKLILSGAENISGHSSAVYISNHQSNFDIMAMFAGLPLQFRWMAKQELFRIPFFGLAMRRSGYIPIERSDRRKAMRSMTLAAGKIKDGTSVIIFPEGTRTPDGGLLPFKKGGFLIAVKAQVPIVPVAIRGSFRIMPKNSMRITPGTIHMDVLPPIPTEGLTSRNINQLMESVRQPIAGLVEGDTVNDTA